MARLAGLVLMGSHSTAASMPPNHEPVAEHYQAGWVGLLPTQIDAVRTCVQDRQPPTLVFHLSERPSGAVGVLSVDGAGVVQRCAVRAGVVVHRGVYDVRPEQLAGFPVFILGQDAPSGVPNLMLEQVQVEGAVVGWLYWPTEVAISKASVLEGEVEGDALFQD
jgi:hypothetical protein